MFSVGGRHYFIEPLKRDSYSKDHFNESDSAIPHQLYPLKYSHSNIHNSTDSHCGISYNGEYTFSLLCDMKKGQTSHHVLQSVINRLCIFDVIS